VGTAPCPTAASTGAAACPKRSDLVLSSDFSPACSASAAGFLIIPALVLLLGLPMTAAVGTSLVIIVVNSIAGFAAHAGDATLDYGIAGAFTLAAVAGSLAASRIATRLPAKGLRRAFAYLVFAVAAFVIIQAVLNPRATG